MRGKPADEADEEILGDITVTLVTAKNGGLTRAQTDCGAPQLTEMEATSTIYVPWPESCGQPVTKSRKGRIRLKQDKRSTLMRAYASARIRALKDNCSGEVAARRGRDAYRTATTAWALCEAV